MQFFRAAMLAGRIAHLRPGDGAPLRAVSIITADGGLTYSVCGNHPQTGRWRRPYRTERVCSACLVSARRRARRAGETLAVTP